MDTKWTNIVKVESRGEINFDYAETRAFICALKQELKTR